MEHDGAEGGAAHPRVGKPHHIGHTRRGELTGDRDVAGLRHSRRALGTGVAQHQHVLRRDIQRGIVDPRREVGDGVEHDRAPGVLAERGRRRRLLDDRTVRREVAAQHGNAALGIDGIVPLAHHILGPGLRRGGNLLPESTPGHGQAVEIELIRQRAQHRHEPAGPVQILHVVLAGGLEIDQHRGLAAQPVEAVEVEIEAAAPGNGREMDHGVGRAADREQHPKRIGEGGGREDAIRCEPVCRERHGARAGLTRNPLPVGEHRRDRGAARQHHAERFRRAGHGAGRPHHHAGAGRGHEPAADLGDLVLVDAAAPVSTPVAPAIGAGAEPLAPVAPGQHRPRDQLDRGHACACRRHELGRHGLVAAADQHHRIERMGADHLLRVHRHEISEEHGCRVHEGLAE